MNTIEKRQDKELRKVRRVNKVKSQIPYYVIIFVPICFFLLFKYLPMFGITMAFQDYRVGDPFFGLSTKWVGLKWFKKLVENPNFTRWITNTLLLSIYTLVVTFPLSIFMALLLNEIKNKFMRKFTANVTLLPYFISTVVIVGIMFNFFSVDDGIFNKLLETIGLEKINFMGNAEWFRTMYVGSDVWRNTGFNAVVFTAAISGIDPTLYEAAAIDGSTRFKNIFRITIPCILPTIIIMFLLKMGTLMSAGYEKIILMYTPATYATADTLTTYAYRAGILDGKLSLATAIDFFNSCCNLLLLIVSNKLTKKMSGTSLF